MSLKIVSIQSKGDANKEFILLQATGNIDLEDYMVADRTFTKDGEISNVHRHTFRFPSVKTSKNDYVALYTRKGTAGIGVPHEGKVFHIFYWNSDKAIWNDGEVEQAELLRVETIDKKTVGLKLPPPPKKVKYF